MKKILVTLMSIVIVLGGVQIANAAGTAEINFEPTELSVQQGDSFNITVVVNPNGESLDTVRSLISWPANLLAVESFSLGELYPNVSPGNLINNNHGLLTQGGFANAGQITQAGTFGTVTFQAIGAGEAIVAAMNGSRLISAGEEKISDTGYGQAVITIDAVAVLSEKDSELSNIEVPTEFGGEDSYLQIVSPSHPNQNKWNTDSLVTIDYGVVGDSSSEVANYKFGFDHDPLGEPTESAEISGDQVSYEFETVEDGIWYFHLSAEFADGTKTDAIHFRVLVDATAPGPVVPVLEQDKIAEDGETLLSFSAVDQTSGIASYLVTIDDQEMNVRSPYLISDLAPGRYNITVEATDGAGNTSIGETKLRVKGSFWQQYGLIALLIIVGLVLVIGYKFLNKLYK